MKKIVNAGIILAIGIAMLATTSCEKVLQDATQTSESAQDFSTDQTAISGMTDLLQDIGETQGFLGKNGNTILPDGVKITYKDTIFTDGDGIEITIDLDTGVVCGDGWKRGGSFTVYSNEKKFNEIGSAVWIGKDHSQINLKRKKDKDWDEAVCELVFGDMDSLYIQRTASDKFSVSYNFTLKSQLDGKTQYSYVPTGKYEITQTDGVKTAGTKDDVYSLSGSSAGENHSGKKYTVSITKDLVSKVDPTCSKTCISGVVELKNDGSTTSLSVDFGDGKCDNDIVITLPGGIKKNYTVE
ncbi:MAG: hypothetical protein GC180_06800 [Bacteroidetes bacterium]|nr:hypothetical protein [Bacteroidota bacterium]